MTEGASRLGRQQRGSEVSPSPVGEQGKSRWIFRVLPPQVRRVWQLVTSYPDYLLQLSLLLRDPIYRGSHAQRGVGQPILLIPGFLVGDWTLWLMAGWLRRLGYRAYLSGIDWNVRAPERTGELLARRLIYIVKETGSPVIIIVGHSLGGMLARSLGFYFPAVIFPEVVRHVVALAAPLSTTLRTLRLLLFVSRFSPYRASGRLHSTSLALSKEFLRPFLQELGLPLSSPRETRLWTGVPVWTRRGPTIKCQAGTWGWS